MPDSSHEPRNEVLLTVEAWDLGKQGRPAVKLSPIHQIATGLCFEQGSEWSLRPLLAERKVPPGTEHATRAAVRGTHGRRPRAAPLLPTAYSSPATARPLLRPTRCLGAGTPTIRPSTGCLATLARALRASAGLQPLRSAAENVSRVGVRDVGSFAHAPHRNDADDPDRNTAATCGLYDADGTDS